MRVIAGAYGGRRLHAPPGADTRPTSDRVREALFSVLGDLAGVQVLDLFAGTGALGLEALSRGAAGCEFVDRAQAAIRVIRRTRDELGIDAPVHRRDALRALSDASERAAAYDLVFLDPPYRHPPELGRALSEALPAVLAPGARVVVESDRRSTLALDLPLTFERRYGDTLIRIHDA